MVESGRKINPEKHDSEGSARIKETDEKRHSTEPKLTFVTPKLVKHGEVEVTGGFGFSP